MILLDTHAWIWWVTESKQLSAQAKKEIIKADTIGICIISCWEVAMLVARQRIGFKMDVQDWIDMALRRPKIHLLNLEPKATVLSTRLPGQLNGDPVDKLIAATCLIHGMQLVTKDRKITNWGQIPVIW